MDRQRSHVILSSAKYLTLVTGRAAMDRQRSHVILSEAKDLRGERFVCQRHRS